jgi:transposase, IS5 family
MRPKEPQTKGEGDLFRARLDQIINLRHELVQLASKIDWDWTDREIAPLYSDKGRPGIETRFVIGLLLLKHIYGLSDEGVCERWVYDPFSHSPSRASQARTRRRDRRGRAADFSLSRIR